MSATPPPMDHPQQLDMTTLASSSKTKMESGGQAHVHPPYKPNKFVLDNFPNYDITAESKRKILETPPASPKLLPQDDQGAKPPPPPLDPLPGPFYEEGEGEPESSHTEKSKVDPEPRRTGKNKCFLKTWKKYMRKVFKPKK